MGSPSPDEILTLEPLIEAIRGGVEKCGWELSGLQKTTSHQFEGRWEGESTRSAYLFFHDPNGPEFVSVDVYLDETRRGLTGNIALVADLAPLDAIGSAEAALEALRGASLRDLDERRRRPLSLRLRLGDAADAAASAETEVRFKVTIPRRVISEGPNAVVKLTRETMEAFSRLLRSPELTALSAEPDRGPDADSGTDADGDSDLGTDGGATALGG